MNQIIIYVLIYSFGLGVGFFLKWWLGYRASYTGTIYVTKTQEKTLYSLELNEYPEEIVFKKEVVFKVDASQLNELSEVDTFD